MIEIAGEIPFWFKGEDNTVSVYSSARISRNFSGLNFPSSPGYNLFRSVEKKTDDVISQFLISGRIRKFPLSALPQEEILRLKRLRVIPEKRNDSLAKFTLYYDNDNSAYLLTNYIDHLTFFSHSQGMNITSAFKNCKNFSDLFNDAGIARDPKGNFITSGIDYFGSGLKCFSVLSLPVCRLAGKIDEIRSSIEYNGMSVQKYFRSEEKFISIISNRDSYSKSAESILRDFKKVLSELKKYSSGLLEDIDRDQPNLSSECLEIINSEHLTFNDFIKIYDVVSFLKIKGRIKFSISGLNRVLVLLMQQSAGEVAGGAIKRTLTDDLFNKIRKTLKNEVIK
ncbi:MAG: hypothetical protein PHF33_08300 [Candidatus Delongbacteria bacterium]|jgi:protein-arginine kinase|nr:hypothetical protein [Candidatus Delongbacteria bacterium]MDY0017963.1 hypothetical protein [Candidatus Delongbacteria bacterium]